MFVEGGSHLNDTSEVNTLTSQRVERQHGTNQDFRITLNNGDGKLEESAAAGQRWNLTVLAFLLNRSIWNR